MPRLYVTGGAASAPVYSLTAMEWFYAGADAHVGPFSETQIAALLKSGAVSHDTLVWREGLDLWIPAGQAFPSRVPPPLPQSSRPGPEGSANPDGILDRVERSGETAMGYWRGLSRERQAALVLGALGVLFAFELILDVRGAMLSFFALLTFLGVIQTGKRPKLARVLTTWGPVCSVFAALGALWAGDMKDLPSFVSVYDWEGNGYGFALRVILTSVAVYVLSRRAEAHATAARPGSESGSADGAPARQAS